MKKFLALLCFSFVLVGPAAFADSITSRRPTEGGMVRDENLNNWDLCTSNPDACPARSDSKRHAKKSNHTGTIIVASVAGAAVFAGVMWYVFKKKPSKNNPGQVKLAEF